MLQITDIVEQPVCMARSPDVLAQHERVRNCVEAHRQVLAELFGQRLDELGVLLPLDLLYIDELLALERPFSVDDFGRALVAKKRLGRFLRRSHPR